MRKLINIEKIVENILEERIDARVNDDILYMHVCEHCHQGSSSMTMRNFWESRNIISCPSFASVTRARRKIFEKRPELKPPKVTELREKAMHDYIDYALN